jgi:dienelactone hydrolase
VRADFHSGSSPVRALFCPAKGGAAAIVLHGCGGFGEIDHKLTAALPSYGIATLYVDYFEPTPPPGRTGFCNAFGAFGNAFPTWEGVVADAAKALRARGETKVALVGWSMGGGLALASAVDVGGFDAVAVLSAFAHDVTNAGALPPTIVLSGGKGDAVPVSEAIALHRALVAAHVRTELHVYPHGNHTWKGKQGAAAIRWIGSFLRRVLYP